MDKTVPLKALVLFIAVGILVVILIVLFVKRQITRFKLKSGRGPHTLIGSKAPKSLKQEIDRRLRRVADIKYEPTLMEGREPQEPPKYFDQGVMHYYYRMKALDLVKKLEEETKKYDPALPRNYTTSLRLYLLEQQTSGALQGVNPELTDRFCKLYECARHEPTEFREEQFEQYQDVLGQLLKHISDKISKGDNRKTFPLHIGDSVFYCPQVTDNVPLLSKPKTTQLHFRANKLAYGGVEAKIEQPC